MSYLADGMTDSSGRAGIDSLCCMTSFLSFL